MTAERGHAAIFDRPLVAALYDVDVRLTSRPIWGASVRSQADLMAGALDEGPVLDAPAGTGLLADRALRTREGPLPLIVAVDLSRKVLLRCRRRLTARAVYVEADVAHLPFRDGALAAVHSANGFHLFSDPASSAAELTRVTRPGGRAVITTFTDRGHLLARAYLRLLARLGLVAPARPPEEHIEVFEAAGLATESAVVTGTLLQWIGRRGR